MTHDETYLFDIHALPTRERERCYKSLETRVWTHTKAQFIARYLKYFVFITKHGTYLDAFAGPQDFRKVKCWAARLVLRNKPRMLRHFILCEKGKKGLERLEKLKAKQPPKTDLRILAGDSNQTLLAYLQANPIKETEATFCLLDQRTFECNWDTVKAIAAHKTKGNKIELLYFLAQGWLDRSLAALKRNPEGVLTRWAGPKWKELVDAHPAERPDVLRRRFQEELGYRYAAYFPIFKKGSKTRIMFYLIHASDHDQAMGLMRRAYANEMKAHEPPPQGELPGIASASASPVRRLGKAAAS